MISNSKAHNIKYSIFNIVQSVHASNHHSSFPCNFCYSISFTYPVVVFCFLSFLFSRMYVFVLLWNCWFFLICWHTCTVFSPYCYFSFICSLSFLSLSFFSPSLKSPSKCNFFIATTGPQQDYGWISFRVGALSTEQFWRYWRWTVFSNCGTNKVFRQ